MTYAEALDYMYSQLPMFHRIGPAAYKPGLENTIALLDLIGNPQRDLKCVHVAGTNGKGSTSHLIASALQEAGYKTGLYTSPHLKDFRERFRINGEMIPESDVLEFVIKHKADWEKIKPSFFEITVAMCFWYFKKEKVDIAVIEVGLGGRLDSTNVITPEVSIITNIGMDHMNLLGDTIEKIAAEKAGIIKKYVPVVIGKMRDEARTIMQEKAALENAPLIDASTLFEEQIPPTSLLGFYQEENRKTAFAALQQLKRNYPKLNDEHITNGFMHVVRNTGLLGRWQMIQQSPLIIVDVAHNEDGLRFVLQQIEETPHEKLHFVLGVVGDKDVDRILKLLPQHAKYYFCKANIPRGLDAEELRILAARYNLLGESFSSVINAFNNAKKNAANEDLVFVGGSVFTVAEVL